ncbi:30S ribosomal protein S13 [Candidatus Roizmanbacteria bacterium RIFCSPLOWO2_12_FULL_40_12]|uniref:Small ribosomal subunit protein uS13 n=1 Tax=Candidatus Roizmanbacteria bacterium RIFCSPLOWO2_01_FULL_40_42 TaxID=1802066 RepID=A0A1F7J4J9_9BACT|nr:MAG: 30S ribosomal protein S13 [Candidatus Roizmanbacteria bacterium RIFCSPHIGHO2_01_FULL_40_98]OGK27294.1 MAG: 30S ribosomal protein S13 [Candidatus Roizmanbacteria bacterium RIFCSPHIGHO2_02_FULL_40_53]OGK30834.1 MAG: 30S ribosomal protein S13 [Candidatus Roizmanbacteria bacterium RIFCSPHIGHO2_12_41_18]OGK36399.1 MAG: 30S ribosomal protein S13 [Candidatus Roizmanbacteria bacterium RIFCSPHIGHO2_12_FULL_40_130]OGK50527.1 MAG: 30S ribosomal protein S13 [Candidatus Roizmanbacteria bacterium RIF
MARLLGLNLQPEHRVEYALTNFYGIGWRKSSEILKKLEIDTKKRVKQLNEDELRKIGVELEKNQTVEGNLREEVTENIKRLREIGSYRGGRHAKGLPVRGQRTKSNSRTKRGKRKTVGALKKEAWAKLEQQKPKKE